MHLFTPSVTRESKIDRLIAQIRWIRGQRQVAGAGNNHRNMQGHKCERNAKCERQNSSAMSRRVYTYIYIHTYKLKQLRGVRAGIA